MAHEAKIALSKEQLLEIASHPRAVYTISQNIYTNDVVAKRLIEDHVSYFMAIFRGQVAKYQKPTDLNKTKTPQTGRAKSSNDGHAYIRTKDNWVEGMPVVQTPNTRQSEVKIVESKMEWAINVERNLHNRYLNDPTFNKKAAQYANPDGELIPQSIVEEIHVGCECRTNVNKELDIRVQSAVKKFEIEDDMQPDWNQVLEISKRFEDPEALPYEEGKKMMEGLAGLSDENLGISVSDNISDVMSEQYVGDHYGEFEEIID